MRFPKPLRYPSSFAMILFCPSIRRLHPLPQLPYLTIFVVYFDMTWQSIQWPFPLDAQPTALVMGIGCHGETPRERCKLGEIWCLHLYRCHGWIRVRGHEFPIRPGYASITPPQIELEHQFDDSVCVHTVAHFSLSPSAIAKPVSLQQFNKTMRRALGHSPRALREIGAEKKVQ